MLYLYYLLLLITTYHPTIGQGGRVVQSYVNRHLALFIVTIGPQIVPSTVMKSEDMEGSRPDLYHDHGSDFYPSL